MRAPKCSAEPCELLLKYERRHGTDRVGVSGNPVQRGNRNNEFNSFLSREFRN